MPLSESWLPATILILAAWAGVVMTILTLPGTWVALLAGVIVAWWKPEMISWWTVGTVGALAVIAEVAELAASAAGAAKGGGSKKGAAGAIGGSLLGAIAGAPFLFPLGSIAGGVAGAWLGTILVERGLTGKTWRDSTTAAHGAAKGRLIATAAKGVLAVVIAVVITAAALF